MELGPFQLVRFPMSEHTLDSMALVFRTDSSPEIGVGHVMRSCAVAEKAISRGIEAVFIGDLGNIDWVSDYVHTLGFSAVLPPTELMKFVDTKNHLILDSYTIPVESPGIEKKAWKKVVSFFDDVTPHYEATLQIHLGPDSLSNVKASGEIYSGLSYIPFRKGIIRRSEFSAAVRNVLVFSGGTDPFGFSEKFAKMLRKFQIFEEAIFLSQDASKITCFDKRYRVEQFGKNLDRLIDGADLVFTSASTSSLEVAVRGIPVGVAAIVENQHSYYESLKSSQIAARIGERLLTGEWKFDEIIIEELLYNVDFRKVLREQALEVLDFCGADRVLELIIN